MGLKKRLEHLLKHNRFVQTIYRYTMSGVFKFIGLFVRMDKKLVLMNGHGFRYNDSPRAIFEKMTELGMLEDYRVVWALKEPDKYDIPNAKKIKMDTFKYFITALKAKYWISCVNIERALHFKKKKTVYLTIILVFVTVFGSKFVILSTVRLIVMYPFSKSMSS